MPTGFPLQLPEVTFKVWRSLTIPEITGVDELLGAVAGMTTPVSELGETRPPKLFVAVIITRKYLPTFPASNV